MHILHTSDWHLGRDLEGRDRLPEQRQFIDELCAIVEREGVHLILVAGDVFDTVNPPGAAEDLFYDALDRLSAGGRRAVVVIAGNHDNPERLTAAAPLAERHGITLLGLPRDEATVAGERPDRVRRLDGGPSWVELAIPGCSAHAVVAALPYPSEARLEELLARDGEEGDLQIAYSRRVGDLFRRLSDRFRPDTVNLAMSHLYIGGGEPSDSERTIQVGGAYTVSPEELPLSADYVALGHLHRPQRVAGLHHVRYSGSPLAYSFSEAGQQKQVLLVAAEPGQEAQVAEISLQSGRPLCRWRADSLEEVLRWCAEGRDGEAWIDLEVGAAEPLTIGQIQMLKGLRRFVQMRVVLPQARPGEVQRQNLSLDERFRRFYAQRTGGREPSGEVLDLFLRLVAEAQAEDVGPKAAEEGFA